MKNFLKICLPPLLLLLVVAAAWLCLREEPRPSPEGEIKDLARPYSETLYVNGKEAADFDFQEDAAVDRVYRSDACTRLVNYHDGYILDLPAGTAFDFSRSATLITGEGADFRLTVTKEHSPYLDITEEMTVGLQNYGIDFPYEDGVDQYIGYYQSRFLLSKSWQENNGVSVSPVEVFDANGHKGYIFHAVLSGMEADRYDVYSYVYLRYEEREFLRILVKYHQENTALRESLKTLLSGFRVIDIFGSGLKDTGYAPVLPASWTEETRTFYTKIAESDKLYWGVYSGRGTVSELEEKLDFRFPVVLTYMHSIEPFPTAFMAENWEKGRMVELTYQLTENNNTDICGYSPLLDLYRGRGEQQVRTLARAVKAFGHPFLFRLCNEMNSDWTSYGGVNNMADPEVFVAVWQRIYEIFEEEGVGNCIWVFNPNDRNCPPNRWNDGVNYYPGNEYAQMLGITGYNNGTYYTQWEEQWREFDTIYDEIQDLYTPVFSAFPWIITEFSSSSVGGDKVAWIEKMFQKIGAYPNIKIAVWFSSADYDGEGNVARPYWLDETEKTTEAFRQGLAGYPQAAS